MKMLHVTDKKNLRSIKKHGLDPNRATGSRKAVWLVPPSRESWAILHTISKPRAKGRGLRNHVVIEVDVPRSWLVKHRRRLWYCYAPIPPSRFLVIRQAKASE